MIGETAPWGALWDTTTVGLRGNAQQPSAHCENTEGAKSKQATHSAKKLGKQRELRLAGAAGFY